ncbi:glycoside hydrolase family 13 protein [Paenibacillus sp. IHBB 10380]|uniref:glycoside hydrolase family 13 protein n=1 Tax=Paenibacillus sp. IHBB 10380 TaxID=1566358 RepID=UPI0005CFEF1B|nr:alpha-glucosidase [Paenibacillus sp. IHBB 10380]AJS61265.1 oligo-1,6-glucosidase [Paenibacillus sp. IHBB 10380]
MNKKWWKECVVYQIYPVSFMDSNGDGIGDIPGIISKLDYLQDLGVEVLWLCPVYKSPNHDNGYDISDYCDIMTEFGSIEDFDKLLTQAHARGLKIMMDLVLNHTSDEHPWFIESKSSKDNSKRDFYIWRKGKDGGPPNNWESYFSGSVWEYDKESDEYYLHLYSKHQPDLNWENQAVVDCIYEMIHWWLKKGIDGFRFDAIAHIVKAEGLPDADNPNDLPTVQAYELFSNLENVHTTLNQLYNQLLFHYDIMTVGETSGIGPEQALDYVGDTRSELNMVFQFEHMKLDAATLGTGRWDKKPWTLLELKKIISNWQVVLHNKGWNANYLCNHDQPRSVSRFGNDGEYRVQSAKMLATFIHMLEGTPYIYQGEEIGMTNIHFQSVDDYRDVETLNYVEESIKQGVPEEKIMQTLWDKSRDNARTPMQWNNSENAGFTEGAPWIHINANYIDINVDAALKDPHSIYHYYRELIKLRKEHEVIVYGEYRLILPLHPDIYAYTRTLGNEQLLVILNFFERESVFELPNDLDMGSIGKLLISNYPIGSGNNLESLPLRPYEARVYKMSMK